MNFVHYQFRPKWWAVALTLLVVVLTTKLGFWQLARAQEKTSILNGLSSQQAPISVSSQQTVHPQQFIQARGGYLNLKSFLLDNQFYQHQPGYHLLTPMLLEEGKAILIDQGWLSKAQGDKLLLSDKLRHHKRNITIFKCLVEGRAYYPSDKQWFFGNSVVERRGWPKLIEAIELKKLAKILHLSLKPYILRLTTENDYCGNPNFTEPQGLVRQWQWVSMSPVRHQAYALQWFSFAIVAVIIFLGLAIKRCV